MIRKIRPLMMIAIVVALLLRIPVLVQAGSPSVPPNLSALEQKMAQIRFNTARIQTRFGFGQLGSGTGGELGGGIKGSGKGLIFSTVGSFRLSPREAVLTNGFEAPGSSVGQHVPAGLAQSTERVIGDTTYTYRPSVASWDGGRPWVRGKLPSQALTGSTNGGRTGSEAMGLSGISGSEISSGCVGSFAYAVAYGMLRDPQDRVTAQAHGTITKFKKVLIPANFHPDGVLVYTVLRRGPIDIVAQMPSGRVVARETYRLEPASCG
jgi:hypothetical protein